MTDTEKQHEFSTIIASSVHDMKNSLILLQQNIEQICADEQVKNKYKKEYGVIQYEARRFNNALVQLLSIYKLEEDRLPIHYQFLDTEMYLEDVAMNHKILLDAKEIAYEIDCDFDLHWSFDPELMNGVLDNIISNSIRYTKDKIILRGYIGENGLVLEVEDNGPGYPADMLDDPERYIHRTNFSTGSTGLGLYFSAQVAKMHKNNNQAGYIELKNCGTNGGGLFRIVIPSSL